MKNIKKIILTTIILLISLTTYFQEDINKIINQEENYTINQIPKYSGKNYITINEGKPEFEESEYTKTAFENYSELDYLKRAKTAYAIISQETMPTEKRTSIGMIKPSGWHTIKYENIEGKYLYNRCHLIGYQLTGQNANEKNLITCTRQMNTEGMLPFENEVANYIKETNNHVLYRVTPIYENENLIATGVQIEASSVEDKGKSISINVFIYNIQDGIEINYKAGESKLKTE